jgi:hypothetical protein
MIVFFAGGTGTYMDNDLKGSFVVLNANGKLSPAGVREIEDPDAEEARRAAGIAIMMQWTAFRTAVPDFAPAYVQVEIDAPGLPVPAGVAGTLTLDRYGNFYTGPGIYAGSPGFNVSAGWLLPNEPPENIESFLTGHSVGGSAISPCWVGGGVTRASGRWSPQVIVGTPGVSGSYTYTSKRAKFRRLW